MQSSYKTRFQSRNTYQGKGGIGQTKERGCEGEGVRISTAKRGVAYPTEQFCWARTSQSRMHAHTWGAGVGTRCAVDLGPGAEGAMGAVMEWNGVAPDAWRHLLRGQLSDRHRYHHGRHY